MSRPIIQQWAGHYITNMEWPVVPLEPRSKACLARGWTQRTFQLHDFRHDSNIGIKSVSGLVVLDDDFPTPAVGCADDLLLPSTSWGRPLKPRSKRIYRCPELEETTTYTDLDGSHLVQLRVGMQDMAPPSIHPTTGEKLQWDGLLIEPAHVDVETLVDAARQYWTARLIAKYWPIRTRHECRLAYARVLLETLEIPDDTAVHILEWACRLGGSDERGINNVRAAVRDTRAKLEAGEATTGGKTVGRLLPDGPRIVRLLRKGYDKTSAVADAVDRLNDRFAIVNVSNKVVVMETWPDGGIKSLWSFPEFQNLLIKESVKVAGKDRPLANIWLKRPDGRQYDRLVYVMPGSSEQCHPDDYNGWLGLTVEPQPGDWSRNRDHLLNVICGGNQGYYDWVFGWVAALVQWPGRHAMTAIVLRGGQGTGKGHFAHRMLGLLFHKQQYLHIIGAEALTGRFNEHLSGKVLVFADESTWGGDPKAAERLKGMVTESTVNIERKFLPLVEEPSALHIIMASNNDWPVAIPADDRRFLLLDVAETKRQNDIYFQTLLNELRNGGRAAMLHDLLAHRVDESALRHPPSTAAKREVTMRSLKPVERWWFERLKAGYISYYIENKKGRTYYEEWPTGIRKSVLHDNYLEFLERHHGDGRTRRATETEVGQFLHRYGQSQRVLFDGKQRGAWKFDSLGRCRAIWVKACGWPDDYNWDE